VSCINKIADAQVRGHDDSYARICGVGVGVGTTHCR
jgi:hypothetical protein